MRKMKFHTASVSPRNVAEAFSLLEMLITITIVAVLALLGAGGWAGLIERGKQVREAGAGKTLITAYLSAAADNNGRLMVAHYEGQSAEVDGQQITLPDGTVLDGGTLHRYPYRLAPYFDYRIDGVILVNDNKRQVREKFAGGMFNYGASLCPAFGINYYFVGGYVVDNQLAGAEECATHLAQGGQSLLVFATAFQNVEGRRIEGRFGVEPPRYRTALWDENLHVDPRHHGRALTAFTDGSLRYYAVDELRDMRLWSKNAAAQDNPDYVVAAGGSGGIGGGGRR